jgi:hypothetical protein
MRHILKSKENPENKQKEKCLKDTNFLFLAVQILCSTNKTVINSKQQKKLKRE